MNAIAGSAPVRVPAFGVALLICWVYALRSDTLLAYPMLLGAIFLALYVGTCAGLWRMQRARLHLPNYLRYLSFAVAVLTTFTFWGTFIGIEAVAPVFATGPIAAVVTSVALYYPVTRIFGKWHWAVPLATGAVVLAIQYDGLNAGRGVTTAVMVSELACLVLLVPLFIAAAIRFNKWENK